MIVSLPYFPVATGEEFLQLLQAASESGPDAPKPIEIEQFLAAHPAAKAGADVRTPTSFAREAYNGVNAFVFVNAQGERQPFRYQFQPVAGAEHLDKEATARIPPDFLRTELPERLKNGPVKFRVMAQLANPGDQTKNSTQPWRTDRRMTNMGTISLTRAVADQEKAQKELRFLPNALQPGIEVSDDPLIDARVRSYVISFGRRAQSGQTERRDGERAGVRWARAAIGVRPAGTWRRAARPPTRFDAGERPGAPRPRSHARLANGGSLRAHGWCARGWPARERWTPLQADGPRAALSVAGRTPGSFATGFVTRLLPMPAMLRLLVGSEGDAMPDAIVWTLDASGAAIQTVLNNSLDSS